MPALGERFRAAREARGLSLSDVSEQIRIRSVYLAAIEEERWSAIGAPVYTRGFLRTYARFLGLDPEEVVTDFSGGSGQPSPDTGSSESQSPLRRSSKRGSLLVWIASLVAVLLVAFVVYNELTMHREGTPSIASASAAPSPLPSPPGASAYRAGGASPLPGASPAFGPAAGKNSLALVVSAPAWLRVTVDGSVSMEGTFPAGTTKTFHGNNALVRTGNAGGVEIYVDGKDVGKLGKSGDVAERAFTL
ncbi:MAG: helix-turn-helix domain-containing protein [Candidatus Tumulicola sp.]